ncbi:MAG: hypothetical protein A2Y82_04995 [Candidatus Buchananbacteria bacterium RBG_13_36_9]|uniref:Uncharacterized protein n=1 Tax=Candidatus Buchananbacteria bacterium RBG_13_36_9 TaxID=1797530 RepID=A0A1G1XSM2_9BACT|nr:MAG: hypothetical protein A2Y82_04995 [Candidatus Buchananbacteria bacterium RBG_13_36_9]
MVHVARAGLVTEFSNQLSSQVISSAANHNILFKISSNFSPNKTIELFFESDFDLSEINYTDLDFKDDDVDLNLGAVPGAGSDSNIGVSVAGQTITLTQNDTDSVAAGSIIRITIGTNADYQVQGDKQIFNPSVAETYKISLSGTIGDYGTISVQILNSDSIGMQAQIIPQLSFKIRNTADTEDNNACSLGTITYFGISQCSYRLAAETNANSGFQIFIKTDGNFRNETNYIANIAENSQVTEGLEGYGLAITAGNGLIEEGDFNDDETPISTGDVVLIKSDSVYNYTQGDLNTSSLITHKAAVSTQTKAGAYGQQIIYSILANY